MKTSLVLAGLAGLAFAGSAMAQVTIMPVPGVFNDISTLPGANTGLHGDDSLFTFSAANGNCILPAGNIVISTNGIATNPGNAGFTNLALTATSNPGYYPFWDDLYNFAADGSQGNIYAANVGTTTIIQWDHVRLFPGTNTDSGTFQIQILNNGGPGLQAIYFYQDVNFSDAVHDNAASATIGAVSSIATQGFAQWSFNTASIQSGIALGVFCVPAPGAAALLGLGGLVALRRRRA